jgi:hypothetical protein
VRPRDRLTAKEIQVAILVWQCLTHEDIAGVRLTSEQLVKANWHMQVGDGLLAWTRHVNFRAAQQSKKSPPGQAEGSCKGALVERRASRPS